MYCFTNQIYVPLIGPLMDADTARRACFHLVDLMSISKHTLSDNDVISLDFCPGMGMGMETVLGSHLKQSA